VQVLDVGEVQGALYLAMEYVHGKDLRNVIRKLQQSRAIMPLGESCYVVREVAQALHHAYWSTDMTGQRLSVVHRDVSPQNVILSYDGTVKLLDFGVAISAVTERAETMIVGKWLYMSPETTMNDQIDHRSDLFSLGVILYLLCSGYMPFTGREPKEIVKKIRAGQYKPLREIVPVPERLAVLVGRLLSPNPDDRPQRGQEVAAELTDIARQYGIESSGSNIANFLLQLFPGEAGGVPEHSGPAVKEIVRVFPDDMGSLTTKEKSPASVTSGSGSDSSSSKALGPVDVSETYRRRTGELSVQSSLDSSPYSSPDASPRSSDPISPLARPLTPRPEPEGSQFITPRVKRMPAPMPTLPGGNPLRIPLLIVIAVALVLATYLLGSLGSR
jgi:serine/threonine-protein kinase